MTRPAAQSGPGWRERIASRYHALRQCYPWVEPVRKAAVTIAAVVLIIGGIAISWLPGPGGFIAFIGLAMLAAEYRWVRNLVRKTEAVGHQWHLKLTGRRPHWWRRAKRRFSTGGKASSKASAAEY